MPTFLPSFRQRFSYALALLFVFVSLNPAHAGMTMVQDMDMLQGMVAAVMDMKDSSVEPALDLHYGSEKGSQTGELTGERSTAHNMNMAMNMNMPMSQDDCQSDCDCCPGFCSVFLPTHLNASTFLPPNFILVDSVIQDKVSTSTSLLRPPISH